MAMRALAFDNPESRSRRIAAAIVVAIHVVLVIALLGHAPARRAAMASTPIVVTFPLALPADRPVEPPKPLPQRRVSLADARPAASPAVPVPAVPVADPVAPALALPPAPLRDDREPAPAQLASAPPAPVAAPAIVATPPSFSAAYLDNPAPPYPPLARRTGEQGRVVLRVLVAADGSAETVELRKSSGSARLDAAALETVRRWRFVPARRGESAVAAWVLVPIDFSLSS